MSIETFEFIQTHFFEKQPYTSKLSNSEEIYFNYNDFQELLIKFVDKSPESIQVTKNGKLVFPNLFSKVISYSEIIKNYREGATITINFISSFNDTLRLLCNKIEKIFECPVECSAFLTPPNVQGFSPHFDSAEVFMVQTEGNKNWKVYAPIVDYPLENQKAIVSDNIFNSNPILEISLKQNSLLYIPRGFIHYGYCDEFEPSIHITFGLVLNRKFELATLYLEELASFFPSFRKSIKYSEVTKENIFEIVSSLYHSFENKSLLEELIGKVKDKIIEKRINQTIFQPDNDLLWHPNNEITETDKFRKRKNFTSNLKDNVLIYSSLNGTKTMSVPQSTYNVISNILNNEVFSVHSLCKTDSPEIIKQVLLKFLDENIIVKA